MRIVVRCLYYLPITPNFLLVDLPDNEWRIFLNNPKERVSIIRPYIREPGPTKIREIAWIPLENLSDDEKAEFQNAIN
ncbi:MAG: hypothetical protein K2H50_06310 [Paramuribaculum sp.]|nr:hypothetical protein [Paramuribaculum sp.]